MAALSDISPHMLTGSIYTSSIKSENYQQLDVSGNRSFPIVMCTNIWSNYYWPCSNSWKHAFVNLYLLINCWSSYFSILNLYAFRLFLLFNIIFSTAFSLSCHLPAVLFLSKYLWVQVKGGINPIHNSLHISGFFEGEWCFWMTGVWR
jgi:hypothetical protein